MGTIRLTTAAAIVRYLIAQRTVIDGCRGAAVPRRVCDLRSRQRHQPRPRAAGGGRRAADVARAERAGHGAGRRRVRQGLRTAARSWWRHRRSGPARLNMVTAAGVAHANRLPVLLLAGDTFASRLPDPVLQQVEHFGDPTITVNDAFKPVSRYWDRIVRPEQIIHSLPHAVAVMLSPADCGPAVLGPAARRAGRGVRLPRRVLRDDGASHRPSARRPRPAAACRRRTEGRSSGR